MSGHAETIRNHLLWKKALSEHDATLHRQLVADGVPWPSADDALAALDALLAENQRLQDEDKKRGAWVESYRKAATEAFRERDEARAENQQLREALERIVGLRVGTYGDVMLRIAAEALAGDTE